MLENRDLLAEKRFRTKNSAEKLEKDEQDKGYVGKKQEKGYVEKKVESTREEKRKRDVERKTKIERQRGERRE